MACADQPLQPVKLRLLPLDRGSLLAQSRFLTLRCCLLLLDERSLSSDLLLFMLDFG